MFLDVFPDFFDIDFWDAFWKVFFPDFPGFFTKIDSKMVRKTIDICLKYQPETETQTIARKRKSQTRKTLKIAGFVTARADVVLIRTYYEAYAKLESLNRARKLA